MFPPQTTGYEERDGSIGEKSFSFYKRVAQGGSSYVIIGGGSVGCETADTLIFANGYHIDSSIEDMLKEANMTYYLIGDGHKVGNIKDATSEGYDLTRTL